MFETTTQQGIGLKILKRPHGNLKRFQTLTKWAQKNSWIEVEPNLKSFLPGCLGCCYVISVAKKLMASRNFHPLYTQPQSCRVVGSGYSVKILG